MMFVKWNLIWMRKYILPPSLDITGVNLTQKQNVQCLPGVQTNRDPEIEKIGM